jgi:hypothetical protein
MINQEELAICKRRGHSVMTIGDGWDQCKWCGIWLRKVQVIEEREDPPSEKERNPLAKYR